MLHIASHFVVPVLVALAFYRASWRRAALLLVGTIVVDADHLLADPIYDPERCSIVFHPLHTPAAMAVYAAAFALPLLASRVRATGPSSGAARTVHLVGLGLLIHMALDWGDCVL